MTTLAERHGAPRAGLRLLVHLVWAIALAGVPLLSMLQVEAWQYLNLPTWFLRTDWPSGILDLVSFYGRASITFLIWSIPQLLGEARETRPALLATCLLTVLALAWLPGAGWTRVFGGPAADSLILYGVNATAAITLTLYSFRLRRSPSWWGAVTLHGLLCAWLFFTAFPVWPSGSSGE